jgi:YVTN family beta-propeller protein
MVTDDIQVGAGPTDIAVNLRTFLIYVVNQDDNSVSVIGLKNNTKIGDDIKVGNYPRAIAINEPTNTIYVTNWEDGTVSVIDGETNKVVAKVDFNIEPFIGGLIECDKDKGKSIAPIAQEFYVYSGSECIAKPNKGFEFLSWEENLNNNSTQVLKVSSPNSEFESIKNFFGIKSEESEAILNVTKFGTFTANFKELPSPFPPEYVATLFGVVVTAFISSWLTPTIIGWRKAKRHQHKLNDYENKLEDMDKDGKLDKKDVSNLNELRENIISGYTRGDITKDQYDVLLNNVSIRYNALFQNEINILKDTTTNNEKIKLLNEIQSDLNDAYLKKKIDKEHYDLLKAMILEYKNKNNNNKNKELY